jgi:hypothetical protein
MNLREEQRSFYRELVPKQFNQTFERQVALADEDPEAARLLEEMRAVRASIRVEVEGDAERFTHILEVDGGQMRAVDDAERRPFFVLAHRLDRFENLRQRCGTSVLGFLGALAGLGADLKLTRQRVRSLRELEGTLVFEVEGKDGFSLTATFGAKSADVSERASIRLTPEIFEALQRGELDAQEAFFDEKIAVEGDMEIAIGAALAALSPE